MAAKKKDSPELMEARKRLAMKAFNRMPETYRKQLEQNLLRETGNAPSEEEVFNQYQTLQPRSAIEWQNRNAEAEIAQMQEEARKAALQRSAQMNRETMAKAAIERIDRGEKGSVLPVQGEVELPMDGMKPREEAPMQEPQDPSQWGTPQENRERAQKSFEKMGRLEALERLKNQFKR